MFTAIKGNTGRTIYVGKVIAKNDSSLRLEGMDWDTQLKMEILKSVDAQFDAKTKEKAKSVKVGDYITLMFMPSRNDPNQGTAEEIGCVGDILSLTTGDKGYVRKIALGVLKTIKRSSNNKSCILGFTDLREDGKLVGTETKRQYQGREYKTYWMNFLGINYESHNNMLADRLERVLQKKDLVAVIYNESEGDYNGEARITNFISNFNLLYRAKSQAGDEPNHSTQSTPTQEPAHPTNSRSASQGSTTAQVVTQPHPEEQQNSASDGFCPLPDELLDELPFA